jgi:hypothetical protein
MLRKEMRTKMIGNAPHQLQMLGRDGNIMDGEYSPSLRCSRRWKYSGWGALPITPSISVLKNCFVDGECFLLPLSMSAKKLLYRWEALSM